MATAQPKQPVRGAFGATDPGPRNILLDEQNPDILVPPETDSGSIPNLKFSFGMAHNRLEDGGWAREVTVRELPISKSMAGVNMRLDSGVVRELHWHKEAEWAYILQGDVRLTVVDEDRHVLIDDLRPGDMWLVPAGIPHSIQGLAGGCEFLLVFDDGDFSENETLLITEFMAHTPRSVLAKKVWTGRGEVRWHSEIGEVYLPSSGTRAARCRMPAAAPKRAKASLHLPCVGKARDSLFGRRGEDGGRHQLSRNDPVRADHGYRARCDARAALASRCRRVAILS